MTKILNVAEKNDAARELSRIMSHGRAQRREGFSKYNKIYEYEFDILGQQRAHMIMTSVSGHLLALDFIMAYRSWHSCPPEALFSADVQYYCPEDFLPVKRTLEKEIRGCQHLILWTDGDREGEGIAQEIVEVISKVKSRGLSVHRARFSEITFQSVMNACRNLDTVNQNVADAVRVRQELDLRIGAAFTRYQTTLLRKAFPEVLSDQLVSYGPCQFPTLGFVVERFNQIQSFVSEKFYSIHVTHEKDNMTVEFTWERGRLFDHTACLALYQPCVENPTAQVLGTKSSPRSKWRPLPMDTVTLEKLGSRKLHINAKETMRIAEKLYTQGFISYPRTETNMFPDSFNLLDVINQQTGDPQWGQFAARVAAAGPTPRQGNKTDNAHPPISPAKYTNTLTGNEQKIYELVVRHFLACCSHDAKGQEARVDIDIANEKFSSKGLTILDQGYLEVYPYDKWTAKFIPNYETGSSFMPTSIMMVDGDTTPPPLLHEADLIGLMEKHGIGTDATHAEHIETIKARNYVGVQPDGGFVPGELGMGLVEGYDSMGYALSKPQLRAELEADLKRICDGVKSKEDVLRDTIRAYKDVFLQAKSQGQRLEQSLSDYFGPPTAPPTSTAEATPDTPILSEPVRKCPHCTQYNLVVKRKKDGGYMLSCLGFPECRTAQFFPKSVLKAEPHESTCSHCQPQPVHKIKFTLRNGYFPPFLNPDLVACSTCDPVVLQDLMFQPIRLTTAPISTSSSTAGRGRGSSSTTRGRGTSAAGAGRGTSAAGGRGRGTSTARGRGVGLLSSNRGSRGSRGRGTSSRGTGRGTHTDSDPGSGGGSGGVVTGRKRAPPTCSTCHQVGHTKRSCPAPPTTLPEL